MFPQFRETTIQQDTERPACECDKPNASYRCFANVWIGVDKTDGRFAEVRIDKCRHCQRLWLRYAVEYEAFSYSGRWARGLISETDAHTISPEGAPAHLEGLPEYLFGGPYFDGVSGVRSGGMIWGL